MGRRLRSRDNRRSKIELGELPGGAGVPREGEVVLGDEIYQGEEEYVGERWLLGEEWHHGDQGFLEEESHQW